MIEGWVAAQPIVPQKIRWGPSDARPAGVRVFDEDGFEEAFLPWSDLDELISKLLPQLFKDSSGYTFRTEDYHGKKDWLVMIFDAAGIPYCEMCLGGSADRGFEVDGLLHVGHRDDVPPVWHTYRRYSDGTYRQLFSRTATIDELKAEVLSRQRG